MAPLLALCRASRALARPLLRPPPAPSGGFAAFWRSYSSGSHVSRLRGTPHLKRKLGQHLLVSDDILARTVAAAELPALLDAKQQQHKDGNAEPTLCVLEIGPGTGNLTSALLQAAPQVHVHAVEFDARMVERLQERFGDQDAVVSGASGSLLHGEDGDEVSDSDEDDEDEEDDDEENYDLEDYDEEDDAEEEALVTRVNDRLTVEQADFEQFTFVKEAGEPPLFFDACVANIPYQLSSIIVSRLTTYMHRHPSRMRCAVLLVQEEFARRLLAQAGEQSYSRLSVNTALVADVSSVVPVPRHLFLPPPKVDSRVIKLTPAAAASLLRQYPSLTDDPTFFQRFDALLRVCFLRKNKTLRALLTSKAARAAFELDGERLPIVKPQDASDTDARVTRACEDALAACALTGSRAVQVPAAQFLMLQHELQRRGVALRPSVTRHFRD